jgi:hypothetical protein
MCALICRSPGMTVRQNGDSEGALSFDGSNPAHAKLAIKIAGVRPKRQLSAERLATLKARGALLANFRSGNGKNGPPASSFDARLS